MKEFILVESESVFDSEVSLKGTSKLTQLAAQFAISLNLRVRIAKTETQEKRYDKYGLVKTVRVRQYHIRVDEGHSEAVWVFREINLSYDEITRLMSVTLSLLPVLRARDKGEW